MRLLWEEEGFELVGAFCVGAFALLVAWIAVDSMFELNAVGAGLLSTVAAVGVLEAVSRRHYAARPVPEEAVVPDTGAREGAGAGPRERREAPAAAEHRTPERPRARPAGRVPAEASKRRAA